MTTLSDIHNAWIRQRAEAAMAIFRSGSVQVNIEPGKGYAMKIHDRFPNAPVSPIYMALRPEGIKTGKLTVPDFALIGQAMASLALKEELFAEARHVAGIPAAGEPFASALQDYLGDEAFQMREFHLIKQENPRKIAGVKNLGHLVVADMQNSLLVDDLVTQAGTKIEAIEAIRESGADVTDLLVFLDSSGGQAEAVMAEHGVRLHSVWEFDTLLEFYFGQGCLTRQEFETIIEYPDKLREYLTTQ